MPQPDRLRHMIPSHPTENSVILSHADCEADCQLIQFFVVSIYSDASYSIHTNSHRHVAASFPEYLLFFYYTACNGFCKAVFVAKF